MTTRPAVAVVVIFQEWTSYVRECVEALEALDPAPAALVLVPDRALPAYRGRAIVAPAEGGIAGKRNAGVKACPPGCDWLAFVDSDAWPREDWLRSFMAAAGRLKEGGPVVAVAGPNLTPAGDPWSRRVTGLALESSLIMGRGARRFRGGGPAGPIDNAPACNLFVRRSALEAVGGFNESYLTSEDVRLCDDLLSAGGSILFEPSVAVYHHRRDLRGFFLQWFNEGLSLHRYLGFKRLRAAAPFLPSALFLAELVLVLFHPRTAAALELLQVSLFLIDALARGCGPLNAAGAAAAMWLFLKAYGAAGLISLAGRRDWSLRSRRDPPAGAAAALGQAPKDQNRPGADAALPSSTENRRSLAS